MRGKTKAQTRYNRLRNNLMGGPSSFHLISDVKRVDNINHLIYGCCDKDENLNWELKTPANFLYQVLRIINNRVLWRDLQVLFSSLSLEKDHLVALTEAFVVLYSLNMIDYRFSTQQFSDPANGMIVFIKEDNLQK